MFKQAGDCNNDGADDGDGNDDSDGGGGGGGLRRSSCRGLRDGRTIGLFAEEKALKVPPGVMLTDVMRT